MAGATPAAQAERSGVRAATFGEKIIVMNALKIDVKPKCVTVALARSDATWGLVRRKKDMSGCPETIGRIFVIKRYPNGWRRLFEHNDPEGCNYWKMPNNVRKDLEYYVRCAREPMPAS